MSRPNEDEVESHPTVQPIGNTTPILIYWNPAWRAWREEVKSEIDIILAELCVSPFPGPVYLIQTGNSQIYQANIDPDWTALRDGIALYPFTIYFACKYFASRRHRHWAELNACVRSWMQWGFEEALRNISAIRSQLFSCGILDSAYQRPGAAVEGLLWCHVIRSAIRQDYLEMSVILSSNGETVMGLDEGTLRGIIQFLETADPKTSALLDKRNIGTYRKLLDAGFDDHRGFRRLLDRIVNKRGMLPESLLVTGVQRVGRNPVSGGGFSDVWKGYFHRGPVALKVLRIFGTKAERNAIYKAFCSEAMIWRRLDHPNVMPFYGICVDEFSPQYAFVSPWMPHGDLLGYLKEHPEADRNQLLYGITLGLVYLHSQDLVHGDFRSANILVDSERQPRISDFGLTRVIDSQGSVGTASSARSKGAVRWQAPELLTSTEGESGNTTPKSDVYAYACVIIELFTGKIPFHNLRDGAVAIDVVMHDRRPERPPQPATDYGLTDNIWDVVQACWTKKPSSRPTMKAVQERVLPYDSSNAFRVLKAPGLPTLTTFPTVGPTRTISLPLQTERWPAPKFSAPELPIIHPTHPSAQGMNSLGLSGFR